jgi:hypothetical protein
MHALHAVIVPIAATRHIYTYVETSRKNNETVININIFSKKILESDIERMQHDCEIARCKPDPYARLPARDAPRVAELNAARARRAPRPHAAARVTAKHQHAVVA